jgi:peptidoglycan hydrolase-like protein with peptidoglycan-binding domain
VYTIVIMKKVITGVGFFGIFAALVTSAQAGYFNSAPIARCETQINRALQVGSENSEVLTLQNFLRSSGHLFATPNGYFGPATKSAVIRFQRDNGIQGTGMVGPSTRNAINERLCDTDLIDNRPFSYDDFGYASGITYVGAQDPFVRVVTPSVTTPTVYATPQTSITTTPSGLFTSSAPLSPVTSAAPVVSGQTGYISNGFGYINPRPNYNPEPSSSVTITSPLPNSVYREEDTVNVIFSPHNVLTGQYSILLENSQTAQSRIVGTTGNTSFSFVLTRELLDAVCFSSCNESQQQAFRVVIATPQVDTYGNPSTFRAAIAPLTVRRPTTVTGSVTLSTSKTPVDSGETFKLFVNFPSTSWNSTLAANYTVKVRAVCQNQLQVTVGGVTCGQDYTLPINTINQFQQEVSARIINPYFQKQDVTFQVFVTNILGQVIAVQETKVTVNSAPLGW